MGIGEVSQLHDSCADRKRIRGDAMWAVPIDYIALMRKAFISY